MEGYGGGTEVYGGMRGAPGAAGGELMPSELCHQGGMRIRVVIRYDSFLKGVRASI